MLIQFLLWKNCRRFQGVKGSYQASLPRAGPCDLCSNSLKMNHYLPGKPEQGQGARVAWAGRDAQPLLLPLSPGKGAPGGPRGTGLPLWGHGGTGKVPPALLCSGWHGMSVWEHWDTVPGACGGCGAGSCSSPSPGPAGIEGTDQVKSQ